MPNLTFFADDRLEKLLAHHGPQQDGSKRKTAGKLGYIVRAYDAILRDEKKRMSLAHGEWSVLLECCWSHSFSMEDGGAMEQDLDACQACVEDTLDSELTTEDGGSHRRALLEKMKAFGASQHIALAWMVIRERKLRG